MIIIKNKIIALHHVVWGYIRKFGIDIGLLSPIPLNKRTNTLDIIVTLTSYGRRVSDNVVYYTLVSLLRQTYPPDRLILWLDDCEWNENNIPEKLRGCFITIVNLWKAC